MTSDPNARNERLTGQQKYDLYHAIQDQNPSAGKAEVRRLYNEALKEQNDNPGARS